jgi:hypothetical protein
MEQKKMKDTGLKPCPFCGKEALLQLESDHHGTFFNLGCPDDNCIAKWMLYTRDIEDLGESIDKWNNRPEELKLREILVTSAYAAGGSASIDCSLEFLSGIPNEIEAVMSNYEELKHRMDKLEK